MAHWKDQLTKLLGYRRIQNGYIFNVHVVCEENNLNFGNKLALKPFN